MRDLNHDFKRLGERNRDGSFQTQHDRESILSLVANQLAEGDFRHLRAQGLRTKHVEHLVARWHADGISAGTFKNRMSALRWLAGRWSGSVTRSSRRRSATACTADSGVYSGSTPPVSTALIWSTMRKKPSSCTRIASCSAAERSRRARCAIRLTSSGLRAMV